jgi:tetratricopeptide (TPR) repeat protein
MSTLQLRHLALLGSTAAGMAAALAGAPHAADTVSGPSQLLDPAYVAKQMCGAVQRKAEFFKPGALIAVAQAAGAAGGTPSGSPALRNDLGTLTIPVTTRSAEAQRYFDQGVRWAYAFNHGEAVRAFRAAQKADPTCAMCYWGEAWALGPNINYPMQPEAVAPAFAAVAQAMAVHVGAGAQERALIEALAARYSADPGADRKALDAAYADAMGKVAAQFPDDDQVQVLFADALMNLQPWDYWASDKKAPKGRTAEQVAALEKVLRRNPDHPGAIHLYIHTVEASTTPGRAEPFADRLNGQMPGAGHLVHMPAHIYYRVGRYLDSLKVNIAAVRADEALLAASDQEPVYRFNYYPHNVHFVLVSARMAGDGAQAVPAAEKLGRLIPNDIAKAIPSVQAIQQAPYFAHAQFSPPATVLALPDPGADLPFVQGSWRYARAMALIRSGDYPAAVEEGRLLREIAENTDFSELTAWLVPAKDVLMVADQIVDAQLARAKGDRAAAATALREAAGIQAGLPYMEPPYWYYPVRQTLGAVLLEDGKADEAIREFQASLMEAPNNAYALFGLMSAQEAAGDTAGAKVTQALFDKAWAGGADRPTLADL